MSEDTDAESECACEGDCLELGSALTEDSEWGLQTTGLALLDAWPDDATTARYSPDVIAEWADHVAGIEGQVHIGVVPTKQYTGSGESQYALVARVPDAPVAAFAAPLIDQDHGDDEKLHSKEADSTVRGPGSHSGLVNRIADKLDAVLRGGSR